MGDTTLAPVVIDTPGVYAIPDEVYHADPVPQGSLSSSGARRLLPPSCPALFRQWRADQRMTPSQTRGVAAHKRLLGVGPKIVVVDADDWRTNAARDQRDQALAAGHVPLLLKDYAQVREMERQLRAHPDAGQLFAPRIGKVEQSLFWVDPEFGVWRRARLDLMLPGTPEHPMLVVDYKTTKAVDDASLSATMANFGYHQQGAWYLDAVEALALTPPAGAVFLLVFQMATPPYLVRVKQPDPEAIQWGRVRNRAALDVYRTCTLTGQWPGYEPGVTSLSLPRWANRQLEADWESGEYHIGEPNNDTEVIG